MKAKSNQSTASLRRNRALLISALAAAIFPAASSFAGTASGTLFYTTYEVNNGGGQGVGKINYNYTGSAFSFSGDTTINSTIAGADGLVFTSDNKLAIGEGNGGPNVIKMDPTTGAVLATKSVVPGNSFHMMVAPDGSIWTSGETFSPTTGGNPVQFNSTLTSAGVARSISGAETQIDSMAWATSDATKAFYVSGPPAGGGNFGTIDLTTGVTTRLLTGIAAASGLVWDPFTGTFFACGANHITQISTAGVILSDFTVPILFGYSAFDTITVDGQGHLFAANNDGNMEFIDFAATGRLNTATFSQYTFLHTQLDDVAPVSGPGSTNPPTTPETLGFATTALVLGGICFLARYRKQNFTA